MGATFHVNQIETWHFTADLFGEDADITLREVGGWLQGGDTVFNVSISVDQQVTFVPGESYVFTFNAMSGEYTSGVFFDFNLEPIPEPGTALLLTTGLIVARSDSQELGAKRRGLTQGEAINQVLYYASPSRSPIPD